MSYMENTSLWRRSDTASDWEQRSLTKTLADPHILPVIAMLEDAGLAAWSLFGGAIGLMLGLLLLRVFSIGI
jgi:hypothetical protein